MSSTTTPDPRRGAAERIERGIERYGEGDLAGAERAFEEALALVPGHERALRCLKWVRDLAGGRPGEAPWSPPPLTPPKMTPRAGTPVLPSLPATGSSIPRKNNSSSTIHGMAPVAPSVLSPHKLAAQADERERDTATREFNMVPTGPNLPPLDVPELTDLQIAELMALDSGLPPPRPAVPKGVPVSESANDASYVIEIEAEPPSARRPSDTSTLDALEGEPDDEPLAPVTLAAADALREAPALPRSPFRDLTPVPLDAGELPIGFPDLPRSISDDEIPSMPTNPFIKGTQQLRDLVKFSSPIPAPLPPPPVKPQALLANATAALERGDTRVALEAVERAIVEGGGLEAAPVRAHHALLMRAYEAVIGPLERVPTHGASTPNLDPRAAFLLSRMDGAISAEDLLDISGMGRLEALRVLALLVDRGAIVMK